MTNHPSKQYRELAELLPDDFSNPDDSIAEVRAKFDVVHGADAGDDVVCTAVDGGVWVDPPSGRTSAVVFFVHGGGFVTSTAQMYAFYGAHVVRATGRSTFIADYSLAPEVRCPKQLIELEQAYTALVAQYGPGQVIVMGDSCGGGMALSLLMTVRERGGPQPAGLVSIGGWFDLTASGDSATVPVGRDPFLNVEWLRLRGRDYVGPDADPADPIASPLFGDHAGLAPMLLHTGTVDRCRSDAERLAASVTEAGGKASITIVDGMPQGFHGLVGVIPEADAAWVEIAVAIESWLKR